jgi:hypothetical protein
MRSAVARSRLMSVAARIAVDMAAAGSNDEVVLGCRRMRYARDRSGHPLSRDDEISLNGLPVR